MAQEVGHQRHPEDPIILAALAVIVVGLVAVLVWLFWAIGHEDGESHAALSLPAAVSEARAIVRG